MRVSQSELAIRSQPRDRGVVDAIGPSNSRQRLPALSPSQGFLPLMWGEFGLAAKSYTPLCRLFSALTGSRPDQVPLELGQAAQHSQHQAAVRGSGVGPIVIERPKARLFVGNSRKGVEQVARGTGEPIQAGDEDDITGAEGAQKAGSRPYWPFRAFA